MAKKQTAAQKHTIAHKKRRNSHLANRTMPKFEVGRSVIGATVMADNNGDLYRIDADNGCIRKLRWEQ